MRRPAGVPRAEWMFVKALDVLGHAGRLTPRLQRFDVDYYRRTATTDQGRGSNASASLRGLRNQRDDEGNPDAYAAGAALAMALENS